MPDHVCMYADSKGIRKIHISLGRRRPGTTDRIVNFRPTYSYPQKTGSYFDCTAVIVYGGGRQNTFVYTHEIRQERRAHPPSLIFAMLAFPLLSASEILMKQNMYEWVLAFPRKLTPRRFDIYIYKQKCNSKYRSIYNAWPKISTQNQNYQGSSRERFSPRERSVREPATTVTHGIVFVRTGFAVIFVREPVTKGIHGNILMGTSHHGDSGTGTGHHGNARECTGIFEWELATTGMHGNVGWNTHKQRCTVRFESLFSVSHEEQETTE